MAPCISTGSNKAFNVPTSTPAATAQFAQLSGSVRFLAAEALMAEYTGAGRS